MATNTGLKREDAIKLIRSKSVVCPACGEEVLSSRHEHKQENTIYKCSSCGEVYRPYKLV